MDKLCVEHYVKRDKEWTSVFIPEFPKRYNEFGEMFGNLYNIRRKHGKSHKRVSLTWRNLDLYTVNEFTWIHMNVSELKRDYLVYNENVNRRLYSVRF